MVGSIQFKLQKPEGDLPTLIYLFYSSNNKQLPYSTGLQIHPGQWDFQQQKALYDERINHQLGWFRLSIKQVLQPYLDKGKQPTLTQVRLSLDHFFGKRLRNSVAITFFDFAEQYVIDCREGRILTEDNRRYATNSLKRFRSTINHLYRYQSLSGSSLDFNSFDLGFYHRFVAHLTANDYSINMIGGQISAIKNILKKAYNLGLHTNTIFRDEAFKIVEEQVISIYLTESDLQQIDKIDLSDRLHLDRTRDQFLIAAYTGLRFSDYHQVHLQNILYDGKMLSITHQKTNHKSLIPLNPRVRSILAKYNNQIPAPVTSPIFNRNLKRIAKEAGLNEPVSFTRTNGGKRNSRFALKWQLVSAHTARRSFATNAYKAGIATLDIMNMTGHKSESSLMRYIKIQGEETALRLVNHPFFN